MSQASKTAHRSDIGAADEFHTPKVGTLTLVGTPIGNLEDMSPRAIRALSECDFIAAEDTRVTLKLLNRFEIKKPLISYYQHNRAERGGQIIERLLGGESCCLVSDAGMPVISDPGEDMVALCASNGITVLCVPGPTAVATALAVSGLPTGRFTFEGFLSVSKQSRREHLAELPQERRTMVFYEAPHKLPATLRDLLEVLGDRRIAIVRELTKLHEEVIRTTLSEAAERFSSEAPRGEIVLVVEGAPKPVGEALTLEQAVELARELCAEGCSVSDAAKQAAKVSGHKKSDIYKLLID